LTLCDFVGAIRARVEKRYPYPVPEGILNFYGMEAARLVATLPQNHRERLCGTGIAMPFNLWSWGDALGAPAGALEEWRDYPIDTRLAELMQGMEVALTNDATAACAAEFMASGAAAPPDFCYIFIGWFVGGGIVLDGKLHPGRRGNAGALGSMLVAGPDGPQPLLERASLMRLEQLSGSALPVSDEDGPYWHSDATERWLVDAAQAIAQAAANAAAVIDFSALRIDGVMPARVRRRLVEATRDAHASLDTRGLSPMAIEEGHVGSDARAVGAAILPILSGFSRDREVLLKDVGN
jgi:predicted NBD/HSP70 family sugar kinase